MIPNQDRLGRKSHFHYINITGIAILWKISKSKAQICMLDSKIPLHKRALGQARARL